MTERYIFTPRSLERLIKRIDEARAAYKAVCDDNPAAREAGDSSVWHDNFAFEENQRLMHQLAHRVRELERILSNAEVIQPVKNQPERVVVGSSVTYCFEDDDVERTLYISGYEDGDPKNGRISYNSPLAMQLLGARPGDEVEVTIGGRKRTIEIISVGPAPDSELT